MSNEFQVSLDRDPDSAREQEIVNGFQQISALEEIWVRDGPPQLSGGLPIMRVYLALAEPPGAASLELADRITEAFMHRTFHDKCEYAFIRIPHGRIPKDLPCRIWKRPPKIWTPSEHRIDMRKNGHSK